MKQEFFKSEPEAEACAAEHRKAGRVVEIKPRTITKETVWCCKSWDAQ